MSDRSEIIETSADAAPKPGCCSRNSGRAVVSTTTGPDERATSRTSMSSSGFPAQCRSSTTMMSGPLDAAAVAKRGQACASASATARGGASSSGLSGIGIAAVAASAKTVVSTSD